MNTLVVEITNQIGAKYAIKSESGISDLRQATIKNSDTNFGLVFTLSGDPVVYRVSDYVDVQHPVSAAELAEILIKCLVVKFMQPNGAYTIDEVHSRGVTK